MGANGAGKSTFVKILTGAVRPEPARSSCAAASAASTRRPRRAATASSRSTRSRRSSRIWTSASNLRLTSTPIEPFRHWLDELGLATSTCQAWRAACRWPRCASSIWRVRWPSSRTCCMLDEMTAALPANLTERVLEVVGRRRGGDRVGHLHLPPHDRDRRGLRPRHRAARGRDRRRRRRHRGLGGPDRRADARRDRRASSAGAEAATGARRSAADATPRLSVRNSAPGRKLQDVSFDLLPGEVLGVVALEGQGQDELFDILAGSERPTAGELLVDGKPASFGHPADAIRAGLVYVAADRAEALLMQRSVRENIALPYAARIGAGGRSTSADERRKVDGAIETAADRRPRRSARCAACRAATSRR